MKTNQFTRKLPWIPLAVFILLSGAYKASATTTSWTGAVSTAWSLPLNWTNGVPTASVDAVIDNATFGYTQDPTLDASSLKCGTLSIDNAAILNGASGDTLTITGALNGTGTLNAGASVYILSGSMTVSTFTAGTSTVILNGTTQSINGYTFYNLIISSGITSAANSIVIGGSFLINTGAEFTPAASATVTGTGSIGGSGTIDVTNIATGDNFGNQYGTTTLSLANLVISYSGTSSQEIDANSFGNLTINNSSGVSATGTITLSGNLNLASGTLSAGSQTIQVAGNITGTGSNFSAGTGTVVLNGSSAQSVKGAIFNNLTIDNTNGGITSVSQGSSTVGGTLTLTSGILTTDAADPLILSSTTAYSGGSNSSFVDGPIENNALSGTNTSYIFPSGNSGKYAPIGVSSVGSTSTFTAQYFKSAHTADPSGITGTNPTPSTKEYWTLTENSGSSAADVTLYWNDGVFSGINTVSDITIYVDDPGSWLDLSGTPTGTASVGSVTAPATSTILAATPAFFTFGDNSGVNPLPVSLVSFTAQYRDNEVNLNWSTASEQNNAYFNIERSADAANWTTIGKVEGHGTSNITNSYQAIDNLAGVVPTGMIYYRLKQVDYNNAFTYSNIQSVNINNPAYAVSTFPNPTSSVLNINWVNNSNETVMLDIVNEAGITVYQQNVSGTGLMQKQIDMSALSPGIYYLRIIGNSKIITNQAISRN